MGRSSAEVGSTVARGRENKDASGRRRADTGATAAGAGVAASTEKDVPAVKDAWRLADATPPRADTGPSRRHAQSAHLADRSPRALGGLDFDWASKVSRYGMRTPRSYTCAGGGGRPAGRTKLMGALSWSRIGGCRIGELSSSLPAMETWAAFTCDRAIPPAPATRDWLLASGALHCCGCDVKLSLDLRVLDAPAVVGALPSVPFAGCGLNTGDGDMAAELPLALARLTHRLGVETSDSHGRTPTVAHPAFPANGIRGFMAWHIRRRVRTRNKCTSTMRLSSDNHVVAEAKALESTPPIEAAAALSASSRSETT